MLRRFQIELSHIDRGIYETLDLRVAQHPSEILPYLLTRTLAYALNYETNLTFSPAGLGDPDSPALRSQSQNGGFDLWIEIGNPSAKRLHKASKAANKVIVYTYKNVASWLNELRSSDIHNADQLALFAVDSNFLARLESTVEKNNRWTLVVQDQHLSLDVGTQSLATEIQPLRLF